MFPMLGSIYFMNGVKIGVLENEKINTYIASSTEYTTYCFKYLNGFFVFGTTGGIIGFSSSVQGPYNIAARSGLNTNSSTIVGDITYGSGLFLCVPNISYFGTNNKYYTANAIDGTWTERIIPNAPLSTTYITQCEYGNSRFVICGNDGYRAWSSNGITFTKVNDASTDSLDFQRLTFTNIYFILLGTGNYVGISTNGFIWTRITLSPTVPASLCGAVFA